MAKSDSKRAQFGSRHLDEKRDVFAENAWDDFEWSEQLSDFARLKIEQNSKCFVDECEKNRFEREANTFWDKFYEKHQNNFFKDRHWLSTEFPELFAFDSEQKVQILELGSGVGNTVFPLLQMNRNPNLFVYCCDFSETAINLLKKNYLYDNNRCHAFVCDISEEWKAPFPESSMDIIVMIFTLSAIAPEKMSSVLAQVAKYLKPNGLLLFRDYGRNDMTQLRFKIGHCLQENFYVRGDGTRAYFFTEEEIHSLFTKAGLTKQSLHVDKRLLVNRAKKLKMYRIWIQAKYKKESD